MNQKLMNKFLIFSVLLILSGFIFFGLAWYCYSTLQWLYKEMAYYGATSVLNTPGNKIYEMAFNLKFGLVKFSILGIVAWVLGIIFFFKRKNGILIK
jgi:hypothetical protein